MQKDGDVFGDGVNIASRLQSLAEPDTICISDMVYRDVAKKLNLGTVVSLGKPKLKNIVERFAVYALLPQAPTGVRQTLQVQRLKLSRCFGVAPRMALLGLVLIAATVVVMQHWSRAPLSTQHPTPSTQSLPLPDKPSIVVLPFDNMSKDPEQDYFSNGITEVLTSDLSRISSLFVIARNTAFTYKGKAVNVQEVGKELGVRYVLEGSVQKAADQVRIVAQLIDTTTGSHIWSERYDRPLTEIFALQDEIVQKIVTTLKLQLTLREQGYLVQKSTTNLEAYDAFLHGGEYFWRFTRDANAQARQMYEKALTLDPLYAEAYGFLAWTYLREWQFLWSQDPQVLQQAAVLGQKAIALEEALPNPHSLLGHVYLWQKQHEHAITQAERAISLNPNSDVGYWTLAFIFNYAGRAIEAIELMENAMRLNPHYPATYAWDLGRAYSLTGRTEEALRVLRKALARNPDFLPAHQHLAVIYSELGREQEARAEAAEILRLSPHFSLDVWRQRLPYKDQRVLERLVAALRKAGLK